MIWLMLLLFGVGVGALSGLFGIGGGIVLVPGLMLLFGFKQPEAQGTSLAVMIPPIGIFAAWVYYEHGFIRLPGVAFIAVGFMIGAFLGAKAVPHLPVEILRPAFGVLLLYLGFAFVLNPRGDKPGTALPAGLAAVTSVVVAVVVRRRISARAKLRPPDDRHEYHI